MKRIWVPLIEKAIVIYTGEGEYARYKAMSKKWGGSDPGKMRSDVAGYACGCMIWIRSSTDIKTAFHEASHVLDNIYETMGIMYEPEFKAYIAGHVYAKVYEWVKTQEDGTE